MDDQQLQESIERLVAEEHRLWEDEARGGHVTTDRQRLEVVRVTLDRCWDLLRQRRIGQHRPAAHLPRRPESEADRVQRQFHQPIAVETLESETSDSTITESAIIQATPTANGGEGRSRTTAVTVLCGIVLVVGLLAIGIIRVITRSDGNG